MSDNSNPYLTNFESTDFVPKSTITTVSTFKTPSPRYAIQVDDPQKHEQFVSYALSAVTDQGTLTRRVRFSELAAFHDQLVKAYPHLILPPMPSKEVMEYVSGDRFSVQFIEKRQSAIKRYLDRIARHEMLSTCPEFLAFLKNQPTDTSGTTAIEAISDVLLNAFTKLKRPEDKFVDIAENIIRLQDMLSSISRIYIRINRKYMDIYNDTLEFGNCLTSLGVMHDNSIGEVATKVGVIINEYSKLMEDLANFEDGDLLSNINEYVEYCKSARLTLKTRDQKQLDTEELENYLEQTIQSREETLYPHLKSGTSQLGGYIKDKLDEFKGVDQEKSKKDRVEKLEQRIKEVAVFYVA
eukprot:NODE_1123_length_2104_cov_0.759102.p1 type:complete len:354 gc:universal NODE_1123_length_2104_cov_0.759102:1550-489(-)